MHHPDTDTRPYGEQIRAVLDSLPDPDCDPARYAYSMTEIALIASTAAIDVGNPSSGKHRAVAPR